MEKNKFVLLASYIFLVAGIADIGRLLYGWRVQIGNLVVPMWIYWVLAFLMIYLSFLGFRASKKI